MNRERRKTLNNIKDRIFELKCDLAVLYDEETECYTNMPEALQMSEKGERAEEAIYHLEDSMNALDEAFDSIEDAMGVQ